MAHPLVKQNEIVMVAGVYDVLSAMIAERAGFDSVVVTGFGVAASYAAAPKRRHVVLKYCPQDRVPPVIPSNRAHGLNTVGYNSIGYLRWIR